MTDLEARVERLEDELGLSECSESDVMQRAKEAFRDSNTFKQRANVVLITHKTDTFTQYELRRMREIGLRIRRIPKDGILVEAQDDD